MHRFYLSPADCQGAVISLNAREAHHALHVVRMRVGEQAMILDGAGQRLKAEVAATRRDQLELKILERTRVPPLPYTATLAQAIPKGKLFEDIIEKATELGAHRIVPLLTERTIGKFDQQEQERKLSKWHMVAIEAIKQCGSAWLPLIERPMSVEQFAHEQRAIELPLVGSLATDARHPKLDFEEFSKQKRRRPRTVSIAIGPEGDFTPQELKHLESAGAHPITLGSLVLRTETAAIYCLSVINHELQAPGEA